MLWLDPKGVLRVGGKVVEGRVSDGARAVRTPLGIGLDVAGRGGLTLGDLLPLRLGGSLTIATWVYLRSVPGEGGQAQILFRGDDRPALDPYSLCVRPGRTDRNGGPLEGTTGGTLAFRIDGTDGGNTTLEAEIPLKRWVRITAAFDAATGEMRIWRGSELVASRTTVRRLFTELDPKSAPGVGIGNVQNESGPHHQPLDGTLVDLRLYGSALDPGEAGYAPGPDRVGAGG